VATREIDDPVERDLFDLSRQYESYLKVARLSEVSRVAQSADSSDWSLTIPPAGLVITK